MRSLSLHFISRRALAKVRTIGRRKKSHATFLSQEVFEKIYKVNEGKSYNYSCSAGRGKIKIAES